MREENECPTNSSFERKNCFLKGTSLIKMLVPFALFFTATSIKHLFRVRHFASQWEDKNEQISALPHPCKELSVYLQAAFISSPWIWFIGDLHFSLKPALLTQCAFRRRLSYRFGEPGKCLAGPGPASWACVISCLGPVLPKGHLLS